MRIRSRPDGPFRQFDWPCDPDGWPQWPISTRRTEQAVVAALRSGRWAISGDKVASKSFEQQFSEAWAEFVGTRFCLPLASGSAGLVVALESLGIGFGDEVILPALTWVACSSAIADVNAVPVLVDSCPQTLCMSPIAVEAAITPRTKAILAVHIYGAMANMDAISSIAKKRQLALIEDASHAHGAAWHDRRSGTFGDCAVFSMQQSKLLTCGEGGALMTNDPTIAARAEQLRADSRHRNATAVIGEPELVPGGLIHGSNRCLSEIQAAILLAQLASLEDLTDRRATRAAFLDAQLSGIPGVYPQATSEEQTKRAVYCYAFSIDPQAFGERSISDIATALQAQTSIQFRPPYPSVAMSPLWLPSSKARYALSKEHVEALQIPRCPAPVAAKATTRWLTIHHRYLLADISKLSLLPEALETLRI